MKRFDPAALRERRRAAGLNRTQLAYKVDKTTTTIAGYETGRHVPNLDALQHLAEVLDCEADEFMVEQPDPDQTEQHRQYRRRKGIVEKVSDPDAIEDVANVLRRGNRRRTKRTDGKRSA